MFSVAIDYTGKPGIGVVPNPVCLQMLPSQEHAQVKAADIQHVLAVGNVVKGDTRHKIK